jgi:hypothetical protein
VRALEAQGLLKSPRIKAALLKVRAIAPLLDRGRQMLTLVTKQADSTTRSEAICEVLYVALRSRELPTASP